MAPPSFKRPKLAATVIGLNKSALRPFFTDENRAKEEDVIDVFSKFKEWDKAAVLEAVNDHSDFDLARLAKCPVLLDIEGKPNNEVTFSLNRLVGYLIASRGTKNQVRCTKCRLGEGPFLTGDCRSAAVQGRKIRGGACGADVWCSRSDGCDYSDDFDNATVQDDTDYWETRRRMNGFFANPRIDLDNVTEKAVEHLQDETDAGRGSRQWIQDLSAGDSRIIEKLEEALADANEAVRVLKQLVDDSSSKDS